MNRMLKRWWATPWKRWTLYAVGLLACGWWVLPWTVPLPPALMSPVQTGRIYRAADGTPLRHLLNDSEQRVCLPVPFAGLPDVLVKATLAAEDKRFWSHGGVDVWAVLRAVRLNAASDRIVSGASTVTQQLVKVTAALPGRRDLMVKFGEALQARQVEMRWSKQQILQEYLNRISYGNQFIGCAAACEGYFRKPLHQLTPAEAAFLAAIPQSPSRLNPFRNPDAVAKRQQMILDRMEALGFIDHEAAGIARQQRIVLQRFHGGFAAPHAVELDLETQSAGAGEIRTTIDAQLQDYVETVVAQRLQGLRDRHVDHAAVVVLENATRKVLALVGSRDFHSKDGGQINGAWTPRSPGSALKPFTYSLALEAGATPATIVADLPIEFSTPTGVYKPENYDHKLYGPMTYRNALGNSLNIAAVRVLDSVGGPKSLVDRLSQLGVSTLTETPEHYGLGLTIGNAPVRLLELTNAYATLASLGMHRPWRLREDEPQPQAHRVIDESAAWLLADILSDNQARLMSFGRHSYIRLPFRAAVKTGTSTSYRDNWTLGFTPEFTVGVWAGNFEGQPMEDVTGVTGAGPIFRDVMIKLRDTRGTSWYPDPSWLVRARIDPRTGKRLVPTSPAVRLSRSEVFHKDRLPLVAQASDYEDRTGRAILGPEYTRWVASQDNWLHDLITTDATHRAVPLRVASPVDGSTVILDPDLPDGRRLMLRAEPDDGTRWMCDTLQIREENGRSFAILEPGTHVIAVVRAGKSARSRFTVKQPLSPAKNSGVSPVTSPPKS